jgi:lysozyme family protein
MAASVDPFDAIVKFTIAEEGLFGVDPDDPGGATNYGITIGTLRRWRAPAPVSVEDVRDLTMGEAINIYRAWYWMLPKISELPAGINCTVFDFGVNAGQGTSIRMLQACIGAGTDGVIGPKTLAAAAAVNDRVDMIDKLAAKQADYYRGLSTFWKFGKGWLGRVERRRLVALTAA